MKWHEPPVPNSYHFLPSLLLHFPRSFSQTNWFFKVMVSNPLSFYNIFRSVYPSLGSNYHSNFLFLCEPCTNVSFKFFSFCGTYHL